MPFFCRPCILNLVHFIWSWLFGYIFGSYSYQGSRYVELCQTGWFEACWTRLVGIGMVLAIQTVWLLNRLLNLSHSSSIQMVWNSWLIPNLPLLGYDLVLVSSSLLPSSSPSLPLSWSWGRVRVGMSLTLALPLPPSLPLPLPTSLPPPSSSCNLLGNATFILNQLLPISFRIFEFWIEAGKPYAYFSSKFEIWN